MHHSLRNRGVVHEPDILEPVERGAGHAVGYPPPAQRGHKLGAAPRPRSEQPQADRPSRFHGIGIGDVSLCRGIGRSWSRVPAALRHPGARQKSTGAGTV